MAGAFCYNLFIMSEQQSLEQIRQIRIDKLTKIRALGVDPYPPRLDQERVLISFARQLSEGTVVFVAGRVSAQRGHGGISFWDLQDDSGKIQLCFKIGELEESVRELINLIDLGDIVGISGKIFTTKAGELSVQVSQTQLLTKALRPFPCSYYGLEDKEECCRRRYLDLMVNQDSKKVFVTRSLIIRYLREFLDERGYLEVETPVLQPLYGGGLAKPFKTYHNALGLPLYLRISTELYLKRLIVGGFEKVYEIGRVFRNEGVDRRHNPEFTILETMQAYISYQENMILLEQMVEFVVNKITGSTKVDFQGQVLDFATPWARFTMVESVKNIAGIDFMELPLEQAINEAEKLGVILDAHRRSSVGLVLASVFEDKVEPTLIQPTFIYQFPVETSPLAKKCPQDGRFVERFEHFVIGGEASNNYSELNDPLEISSRFEDERKKERLGDEEAHQSDQDFVEALEYGMPPTSGLGPGIDRLVMVLTNTANIRDVILFPAMRPKVECDQPEA